MSKVMTYLQLFHELFYCRTKK